MNTLTLVKTTTIALTAALAVTVLSGCQQETAKPLTAEEKIVASDEHVRELLKKAANMNQPVLKETQTPAAATDTAIGENMDTVVFDGSSEASFRAGLEEFQSIANANEIGALNSAISYLKVYDLSARGNTEKLYRALDGLTAKKIVERAAQIRKK